MTEFENKREHKGVKRNRGCNVLTAALLGLKRPSVLPPGRITLRRSMYIAAQGLLVYIAYLFINLTTSHYTFHISTSLQSPHITRAYVTRFNEMKLYCLCLRQTRNSHSWPMR